MSSEGGKKIEALSRDHKPSDPDEKTRIIQAGGKVYINMIPSFSGGAVIPGPIRVQPGRLSVSRSFGDIEAKLAKFGGNDKVVTAVPEIKEAELTRNSDFIFLGSDGVYDKLSNEEIAECIWAAARSSLGSSNSIHEACGKGASEVIKLAMNKGSLDNVTGVVIGLKGLEQWILSQKANVRTGNGIGLNSEKKE